MKVGDRPRGIGFLPDGTRAYVAAENADTVNVFDVATHEVIARIKAGSRSNGVTVHPDGKRVYVTSGGKGTVQVIDTATNAIVQEIPVGKRPWNMALTPDGRKLYVACGRSNAVAVDRHRNQQEDRRDSGRRAAVGRGDPLSGTIAPARACDRRRRSSSAPAPAGCALAAVALGTLCPASLTALRAGRRGARDDVCATPARFDTPLHVPGRDGLHGHGSPRRRPVALRATARTGAGPALAFVADAARPRATSIRRWSPAAARSAAHRGSRTRPREPTIVHWHGLADRHRATTATAKCSSRPGAAYDYAFTVRNRAGLYWYHPHPHGTTAGQTYRGLFGLIVVEDDDERRAAHARSAWCPATTEIPLVLQDRQRADARPLRARRRATLLHGWYGDETLVNFTARPYLDVDRAPLPLPRAERGERAQLPAGVPPRRRDPLPFLLLGTDGGLLERAQPCTRSVRVAGRARRRAGRFRGHRAGRLRAAGEPRASIRCIALPAQRRGREAASADEPRTMRAPRAAGTTTRHRRSARRHAAELLQFRIRAARLSARRCPRGCRHRRTSRSADGRAPVAAGLREGPMAHQRSRLRR